MIDNSTRYILTIVRQALQLGQSNKFGQYTDTEIIDAFNIAQERYIEELVKKVQETSPGYDGNDKAVQHLRNHLRSHRILPAIAPQRSGGLDSQYYRRNMFYSILPQDFMYTISDTSEVEFIPGSVCGSDPDTICTTSGGYKEYVAVVPYQQVASNECLNIPNFRIILKEQFDSATYRDNTLFNLTDFSGVRGIENDSDKRRIVELVGNVLNSNRSTPEWFNSWYGSTFHPNYEIEAYNDNNPNSTIRVYWNTYRDIHVPGCFIFVTTNAVEVAAENNLLVTNAAVSGSTVVISGQNFTGLTDSNITIGGTVLTAVGGSNSTVTDSTITIPADKMAAIAGAIGIGDNFEIRITNGSQFQSIRYLQIAGTTPTFTYTLDTPGITGTFNGIFINVETDQNAPTFTGNPNERTYTWSDAADARGARGRFVVREFTTPRLCRSINPSNITSREAENRFLKPNQVDRAVTSRSTIDRPKNDRPISTISDNQHLFVYTDGSFIIKNIILTYVRRPNNLSLEYESYCELPTEALQEVIDRTVSYIQRTLADPGYNLTTRDIAQNQ